MDDKWMIGAIIAGCIAWVLMITAIYAFSEPKEQGQSKPCEMKVYQYMDEYRINTSCGHIVIERCPFCDKRVKIVVED